MSAVYCGSDIVVDTKVERCAYITVTCLVFGTTLLEIEVALIPTKLRIYPYDTPTHSRVGQFLVT